MVAAAPPDLLAEGALHQKTLAGLVRSLGNEPSENSRQGYWEKSLPLADTAASRALALHHSISNGALNRM